ncbi:hypothetical protein L2719_08860 [Shewanella schlegeliana]|uniref:Uncharacterized protein n=1 Tax=Shewanella schlegeliana TaxID=190308 RepID=A0ABS1T158_9GAMM|nr:hypothetical protein [Shewanella schlegeliana]MBL4914534.1 hypothetical protein [Shewanella schlegeliana]MCL1109650.1 hypothetical protein [Shewanella schlegeliana]GIU30083.1 hypothetical protein TUM4433_20160 [Shewanella schlegeliana]
METSNESPKQNKAFACIWFVAALALVALALHFALNGGLQLVPSCLGLAVIQLFIARQRLTQYQLPEQEFKKLIRKSGLVVVLMSSLGVVFSSRVN